VPRIDPPFPASRPAPGNAAEIRRIFSDNLRQLVRRHGAVAGVCRTLEINRTQFNRYLAGSSFPRPDVLDRITRHFGVDARIMTTPLAALEAEARITLPLARAAADFAHLTRGFDHERMPDGLYTVTLPRIVSADEMMTMLFRLYTLAPGAVAVDWAMPDYYTRIVGGPRRWRRRRATGIVLPHIDGVSFHIAHASTRVIRNMFFGYGYHGSNDIHAGYVASTMRLGDGRLAAFPALLERVPPTMAAAVAARRRCRAMPFSEAPECFRLYYRSAMQAP